MRLVSVVGVVLVTTQVFALPSAARADVTDELHRECQTGVVVGDYTQKQFSEALRAIQADLDQYTDCRDVLRRAQLAAASNGSSKTAVAGSARAGAAGRGATGDADGAARRLLPSGNASQVLTHASPAERDAVRSASQAGGNTPVIVGGKPIYPDASSTLGGVANTIPTPLVVALLMLGFGTAAGGARSLLGFVRSHRTPAV